jgi:hypothetical protein
VLKGRLRGIELDHSLRFAAFVNYANSCHLKCFDSFPGFRICATESALNLSCEFAGCSPQYGLGGGGPRDGNADEKTEADG